MNDSRKNQDSQEHLKKIKEKQLMKIQFVDFMKEKGLKMDRFECCGDVVWFKTNEEKTAFLLAGGNFCNNRFCPKCSWLRAKRDTFEILELLKVVQLEEKKEYIFITLTAPNVPAEKLSEEITEFNKAFQRLVKMEDFKKISKGFIRKLEVTYNEEENTYHPHFHCIVAVNKSYFKSKFYISERKLLEMWKKAKRDDSITQVDMRKCKMDTVYEALELATYSTKQSQLYKSKEIFDVFYKNLKGRQLITFSGVFKDYKKKIELGEVNPDEILELKAMKEVAVKQIVYKWENEEKEYIEVRELILPESERTIFYNLEIDVDR